MKRLFWIIALLLIASALPAQTDARADRTPSDKPAGQKEAADGLSRSRTRTIDWSAYTKWRVADDSLMLSDFILSIERMNDRLNAVGDSVRLPFEVVAMSRKADEIAEDVRLIRQNVYGRRSALSVKNLYLYQSIATHLDEENGRIQARIAALLNTAYRAKLRLKTALTDSVFTRLSANSVLREAADLRLNRLERRWTRTDSVARASIDSLNAIKVKIAENSLNLSTLLNLMEGRLDRAGNLLFGPEVNKLWRPTAFNETVGAHPASKVSLLSSETRAIGFYLRFIRGARTLPSLLGLFLFVWLYVKTRQFIKRQKESRPGQLPTLTFLENHPILSLVVVLLCLLTFYDVYAPAGYIAITHLLLLTAASLILLEKRASPFRRNWMVLVLLFSAAALTYVMAEPSLVTRVWLLALHVGILVFTRRFIRSWTRGTPHFRWIKRAATLGMLLPVLAILANLFGRFSLAGILGFAGIYAITHLLVLTIFVDIAIECVLLQLQSSRWKKGIDQPFDATVVVGRISKPLYLLAALLWLVMLASNLNIYYDLSSSLAGALNETRTLGSISFRWISVVWFVAIIWLAHLAQRLISFLFGEAGAENEQMTPALKAQHSRLLIFRLLLLLAGYMLAVAASGLPVDKLTIVLGALGIGVGMGLQNVVNNFVSGIILIFDKSLQVGDQIEISGQKGKVKEIGLRASLLSTADGADVIIPNGTILSQNIVNWTYSSDDKRVTLHFSVSGREVDTAVITEVVNSIIPALPNVLTTKKPALFFTRVTAQSCWLTVNFWSTVNAADTVVSEAMVQLSKAFAARNLVVL